jgi:hypothetical protein
MAASNTLPLLSLLSGICNTALSPKAPENVANAIRDLPAPTVKCVATLFMNRCTVGQLAADPPARGRIIEFDSSTKNTKSTATGQTSIVGECDGDGVGGDVGCGVGVAEG